MRTTRTGAMVCTHHLWDEPSGVQCTRRDVHDRNAPGGHVYESRDGSCTNPTEYAGLS